MTESERNLQEPQGRPTFASRSALVDEVFVITLNRVADALVPVLADYFVRLGVAAVASPQSPTSAAATRQDLHRALAEFARTSRCPPILRYVIPGLAGEQFAVQPPHPVRDRTAAFERLEAEEQQHIASLADFGERAHELCRSISLCLFMLMPDPADYPKPSAMASALRIGAALEDDLRQLDEQSAAMSDVEKLSAFRERLRKLRWKHTYCEGGWRPPSAPLPPRRGIRIGGNSQAASDDEEPEPPPPDPAALELRAWEHEAAKQWRDAHGVMWLEVVLPVAQSCRDVGDLAQKHAAGEKLVALTLTAFRELWQHAVVAPNKTALTALKGIEEEMDLLCARVVASAQKHDVTSHTQDGSNPTDRSSASTSAPVIDPQVRVSYHDALRGRADLCLPRTPKTTLTAWCKNPQTAADLGVNPEGKVAAQAPLVAGLLRLHAQKSAKRRPPQTRGT